MSVAPVLVLLVCGTVLVDAVDIGGACTSNTDCTVTNSHCSMMYSECSKGTCACNDDFNAAGTTTTCKPVKVIGATCSSTDFCNGGSTCSGSTCTCPTGKTKNEDLNMCVTTGEEVEGKTCTSDANCYMGGTTTECVAAQGATTKYCRCKSGYVVSSGICKKPTIDQTCTTAVGCESGTGDSSVIQATCVTPAGGSTYSCKCPSTADMHSWTMNGMTTKACLTKITATALTNGATCTLSKDCMSKQCMTCPGASGKVCVTIKNAGNHGESMRSQVGVLLLSIVVLPFLNRLLF